MKKLILVISVLTFTFLSCKKEDTKKDCSLTEKNLVGNYMVTSVKYLGSPTSQEIDFFNDFYDACQKDDIITISADHTYTYADAGTKCQPNGDYNGTWALQGTTLSLDGDGEPLENFDCSGFSVSQTDVIKDGDKITVRYTKK
jgi:hypothetical protein